MPKTDLRQILVAFHERGWGLYELPEEYELMRLEDVGVSIDNIVPTEPYLIMPASPAKEDVDGFNTAERGLVGIAGRPSPRVSRTRPHYTNESGQTYVEKFFVTGDKACLLPVRDVGIIRLPLDDAVRLIRFNLSSYFSEKAREWERMGRPDGRS